MRFLCAFCAVLAVSCTVFALSQDSQADANQSVCIDGIYYELNDDIGAAAVIPPKNPAEYRGIMEIPGEIKYGNSSAGVEKTYTVTIIGMRAFYDTWVSFVTLPDSIEWIQPQAFENCTNLAAVNIPANLKQIGAEAFYGCNNLQVGLVFPESLETIGNLAFCSSKDSMIKSVTFMGEKTQLGYSVFSGDCSHMVDGKYAKKGSFVYKDGKWAQTAGKCGDSLMWSYENGTLSVTGNGMMYDFVGAQPWSEYVKEIESIMIGDGVTTVGRYAFKGCASVTSAAVPDSLRYFGERSFEGCTSLAAIVIPDSASAGESAFGGCTSLKHITVGKGTAFAEDPFPDHTFYRQDGKTVIGKTSAELRGHGYFGETIDRMTIIDAAKHTVSYDLDGGSGDIPDTLVEEGKTFPVAEYSGTKKGYTFAGWFYDGKTYQPGYMMTMGSSDIEFKAVWKENPKHNVTYDANGGIGEPPKQDPVPEGMEFKVKQYAGYKPGYSFAGWIYNGKTYAAGDEITMGGGDITLVAKWKENPKHKVTYDTDGGTDAPPQQEYAEGVIFAVADYHGTKEGYTFIGWNYDGKTYQPGDIAVMGGSDIKFIAIWEGSVKKHVVSYDPNGGSIDIPDTLVKEGDTFEVAGYSGTKKGYTFSGWLYDGKTYQPGHKMKMGSSDIEFKAVWKESTAKHTVSYDLDGGSGEIPDSEVEENKEFTVADYHGTKKGYAFAGWSYGGETYQPGHEMKMGSSDIEFKAIWHSVSPNTHRVTYDLDGGSGSRPIQSPVAELTYFIAAEYSGTKEGCTFAGWLNSDDGWIYLPGEPVAMWFGDITLKAVWKDSPGPEPVPPTPPEPEPEPVPVPEGGSTIDPNIAFVAASAAVVSVLLGVAFLIRRR